MLNDVLDWVLRKQEDFLVSILSAAAIAIIVFTYRYGKTFFVVISKTAIDAAKQKLIYSWRRRNFNDLWALVKSDRYYTHTQADVRFLFYKTILLYVFAILLSFANNSKTTAASEDSILERSPAGWNRIVISPARR